MALALWVTGGIFFLVFFGTWAIQIALWLLACALRLAGGLAVLLFGLASLIALAFLDRKQFARIWRNERTHADNAALLARERGADQSGYVSRI
jgi:membrane protein implicated in regulation of membrane protease activity